MRIVAMHRYFPPDVNPYGAILRHIVGWWREAGHDVHVIAGKSSDRPSPPSEPDVTRCTVLSEATQLGRLVNLMLFPLRASLKIVLCRHAPDVVMCGTMPQVTMGSIVSIAARIRKAAFVYHCMDLHPEAGALSGDFTNPAVYRFLRWLDTRTMRRAARIVVLSRDMKNSVLERNPDLERKIVVLNNFALEDAPDASVSREARSDKAMGNADDETRQRMRVAFTGNLGRFQGLDVLIRAHASLPSDVSIELILMGQGRERQRLRELADDLDDDDITFLDAGSADEAAALMRASHLGVVSLAPGVIKYAFPSKTANYLAVGLPILVICDSGSALVQDALDGGYGYGAAAGDVASARDALEAAYREFTSSGWDEVVDRARAAAARESRLAYRHRWIEFVRQVRA